MGIGLIRNLRITNITTQLGNVFTTPTLRYSLFFLKKDVDNSFNKNNKGNKREFDKDEDKQRPTNNDRNNNGKRKHRFQKKVKSADDKFMTGSIINNLGNRLFLPNSLPMRYCREFLDAIEQCKHKKYL